ncbi:MAG: glycosyltransferase family 2 protein [Halioglobus sp.]|nr:glycosyltransferase family 2 protein [Halioglobus sp.]
MNKNAAEHTIGVIIPCFKVRKKILDVIAAIGAECSRIYVVDDCCPEGSGDLVEEVCTDSRVTVLRNDTNLGVGGAVMAGYQAAIDDGITLLVKVDGDGQMDPRLIMEFVAPIIAGEADYTKGNRFFDLEQVKAMPAPRIFGNAILSFMAKFSTGYWDIFDPTNGFTAIHRDVARSLPFHKISRRFFFETDMLFRLNILRAAVVDVPMDAKYADEVSNLKISNVIGEFFIKHIRNFFKRIFYSYYLRDMSLASMELPLGLGMIVFGSVFGAYSWIESMHAYRATPAGTVMLAVLPILVGLQFVLAFISHDVSSVPKRPLHPRLRWRRRG